MLLQISGFTTEQEALDFCPELRNALGVASLDSEHSITPSDAAPGTSGETAAIVWAFIEAAGAALFYLPPYSPDFNPIEMAFSKLKAALRKAAARTIADLWQVIAKAIDTFTPTQCENYFAAAGYDRD